MCNKEICFYCKNIQLRLHLPACSANLAAAVNCVQKYHVQNNKDYLSPLMLSLKKTKESDAMIILTISFSTDIINKHVKVCL